MTSKLLGIYLSYLMALIASNIISFGYSMLSFYLQTVSFKYPILCYITYLFIVALIFFATGYIAQKHLAPPKKASLYFLVFLSITVVTITLLLLVDFFFPLYIINAVWFQIAVQTVNFINKAGYSALPLNVIESIIRIVSAIFCLCLFTIGLLPKQVKETIGGIGGGAYNGHALP